MARFSSRSKRRFFRGTTLGLLLASSLSLTASQTALARPYNDDGPATTGGGAERTRNAAIRYQLGANAFRNARYREAVTHFLAADALVPSAALSYNTALAYDKLMEAGRALSFYRDYLRREPLGENADEVAARIRELELQLMRKGVQQLTIVSEPPGAVVRIEDEPVGRTPWTGELEPGEHRLSVALTGYLESTRRILLPAANAIDVRFQLDAEVSEAPRASNPPLESFPPSTTPAEPAEPAPPSRGAARSSSNLVPWLTVGVGAAALVASGTFELLRAQAQTQAEDAITPERRDKREDRASTYRTTSLVLLGTGGGLVFTGSMLLLFGGKSAKEPSATVVPAARREAAFDATLGCSTDGCFGTYQRRF